MSPNNKTSHLQFRQEIARDRRPALIIDEEGRILCRNRAAAELIARQRSLAPLLEQEQKADNALLLRPVRGETALLWIQNIGEGRRKVLFIRDLPELEANLFRGVLHQTGVALSLLTEAGRDYFSDSTPDQGEALKEASKLASLMEENYAKDPEEPLELNRFLRMAQQAFPSAGLEWRCALPDEKEWWVPAAVRELLIALGQSVRLLCGPVQIEVTVKPVRQNLLFTLSYPDQGGTARALTDLFSEKLAPEISISTGLLPLLRIMRRCQEENIPLQLNSGDGRALLTWTLPAAREMPAFFIGARKRKRRFWM